MIHDISGVAAPACIEIGSRRDRRTVFGRGFTLSTQGIVGIIGCTGLLHAQQGRGWVASPFPLFS